VPQRTRSESAGVAKGEPCSRATSASAWGPMARASARLQLQQAELLVVRRLSEVCTKTAPAVSWSCQDRETSALGTGRETSDYDSRRALDCVLGCSTLKTYMHMHMHMYMCMCMCM
jgi:hypothetical protein